MKRLNSDQTLQSAHRRRGSLTVWSLFAMIACLCCVSLVVNRGIISNRRTECHQSAQTAALATARTLLTDDLLRQDRQQFEIETNHAAARQAGVRMASMYHTRSLTPILMQNNIHIGSMLFEPQTQETIFLQNTSMPNRVEVGLANQPGDASGRMVLSHLTGVREANISTTAIVTLNNRIAGFRALPESPIPFVPLAIPDTSVTGGWQHDIEEFRGPDDWSWNTQRQTPEQASDRLPEISVTVQTATSLCKPDASCLIAVGDQQSTISQIRSGISAPTILHVPFSTRQVSIRENEVWNIASALRSIIGQPRIFALKQAEMDSTSPAATSLLTRFVSARILDVQHGEECLMLTLQPCVMSTATAVIAKQSPMPPENRYIWNINLTR